MSRLDLIIFGATGFTGKQAALEAAKSQVTWGVAGRNKQKLQDVLDYVSKKTGEDNSNRPIVIAEVSDPESLQAMCASAAVVVNCCGPYRLYGEPVVKAAIAAGSHYVDVSGEPQFIETMQLEYNNKAKEAGVFIVSACGFDSIPNDMGVVFLYKHFDGTLNSVESYLSTYVPPEARKQGAFHSGTWESLVHSLAHWDELKPLRKRMWTTPMPTFKPKLQSRGVIHNRDNAWCVPFLGADSSIVYRTQRYFYETTQQRPIQFKPYWRIGALPFTLLAICAAAILKLLCSLSFTRKLLIDHPMLFSLGLLSKEGPTEEVMNKCSFKVMLYGEGWEKGADVENTKPNKTIAAKVTGVNPGYGATTVALIHSAITILKEKDKMPKSGGVYTSGILFANTSLIERLTERNLKFEIVSA